LYLGDNGRQYNVGLFHGDRTGHLMVMCNARIVLIDFSVKQAKDYSFFIDDELFELSVEGKPGHYAYNCSINEDADTPRNRIRKKQKKLDFRKTVALIAIFALVLVGVLGFAMVNQKAEPPPQDLETLLHREGLETVARVYVQGSGDEQGEIVKYSFVANGHAKNFEREWEGETVNGFPLQDGDEFKLMFLMDHPRQHRLDFGRPTSQQIQRYLERTVQQHRTLNPKLTRRQARCQVQVAFQLGGVDGLALMYNQDKTAAEDPDFNEQIYHKFIRDVPFQEAVEKECWN
jgi:hypothetical protein